MLVSTTAELLKSGDKALSMGRWRTVDWIERVQPVKVDLIRVWWTDGKSEEICINKSLLMEARVERNR